MAPRELQVDARGCRLAVRDHGGEGVPLLLLHGGGGRREQWDPLVGRLRDGFRIVDYDARGHGASEVPPGFEAADFLDDVDAVAAATGLDRPVLVGHSMGGAAALRYAAARDGCRGAVALDGAIVRTDEPVATVDARAALRELRAAGFPEEQLAFLVRAKVVGAELTRGDSIGVYERMRCPVLLVLAERGLSNLGPYTPKQRAALADVPVPRVWLDCGHDIVGERPDDAARLVRGFAAALR